MLAGIVQIKPIDLKDALPVLGVAIGWSLNELSQLWRARREDRKAIGKALSDLMLIRHRLLWIPKAVEEISKHLPIPEPVQVLMGHVFSSWIPVDALTKRYEEAVTVVSGIDPLLGFRLRSQDLVSSLTGQLRAMALNDPGSVSAWPKFERWFLEQIVPELDKMVLDVAWSFSWLTWFKTRRKLRKTPELPPGALESLISTLQATSPQPAEGPKQEATGA